MITATNKATGLERIFTDKAWEMLETGGHDQNWANVRRSAPQKPAPPEVAEAAAAEGATALRGRKPFGDNPPPAA